ncbi:MAG: NfeD family protein [Erysipelothrix sp.]|nr:NfeD family protein [Erysipelothrix sp.]
MMDYIWIIVLVLAILIELLTVGNLVFVWFSFGALAAWIGQRFGLRWELQIVLFSLVTLISLFFVRPLTQKYLRGEVVSTNMDRMIGTQFRLEKDLDKTTWYQQNVGSTLWSIVEVNRKSLKKDTLVEVVSIEGVKLVVKSID